MEVGELSVLFLNTHWSWDHYGISTVSKSLVRNLNQLDDQGKKIRIYCTVLDIEGKVKESDITDAKGFGVTLIGARLPRGNKSTPNVSWLTTHAATFYKHLPKEAPNVTHIVGHLPYLPY